ncbi:hypothetical protein CHUAL_012453 [Chamberlinius hualienensis]
MNTATLNAKNLAYLSRLEMIEEKKKLYEMRKASFEEKKEKHNEYLQDLESKIENSLAIIDDVEQQMVEKNKLIKKLKLEVKQLQKQKEVTQQMQKQCKVSQFLQHIIESSNEEFKYPKDITAKYQTLNHILKELNQKQITTQSMAVQEKSNIQDIVIEFKSTMSKLKCNIEHLKEEWSSLQLKIKSQQIQLETTTIKATENQQNYQQKKLAVSYMANVICKKMNKQLKTNDPIEQLDKVQSDAMTNELTVNDNFLLG